jgi:hypothetical protein
MDDEELEPEILTYQEFRNRQTLLAWQRRWLAYERQQNPREGGSERRTNRYSAERYASSGSAKA